MNRASALNSRGWYTTKESCKSAKLKKKKRKRKGLGKELKFLWAIDGKEERNKHVAISYHPLIVNVQANVRLHEHRCSDKDVERKKEIGSKTRLI
jgi:hypothetical protein